MNYGFNYGLGKGFGNRVPPLVGYQPLEDHPDWYRVGGVPTNTKILGETISMLGTTSTNTPIVYDATEWANGSIEAELLYRGTGTGTATFIMATRLVDNDNYIGLRTYGNKIEIHEKKAGSSVRLFTAPNPAVGTIVKLSVINEIVILYFDGVEVGRGITAHRAPGFQGMIARAWNVGAKEIISGFKATEMVKKNYAPITAHKNWNNIDGSVASYCQLDEWGDILNQIVYVPQTNSILKHPVVFKNSYFSDGWVEARFLFYPVGNATYNFPLAMRMSQPNNVTRMIGLRSLTGNIQIYENIDGVFRLLLEVPNPPIFTMIRLHCTGANVALYFDGVEEGVSLDTTLLQHGAAGTYIVKWNDTGTEIMQEFDVGAVLGKEEVSNFDFLDGTTNWNGIAVDAGIATTVGGTSNQVMDDLEVGGEYRLTVRADRKGVTPAAYIHNGSGVGVEIGKLEFLDGVGYIVATLDFVVQTETTTVELRNGSNTALWDYVSIKRVIAPTEEITHNGETVIHDGQIVVIKKES